MPEVNGYKTIDLIAKELGTNERKIRQAIDALGIQHTSFGIDLRAKFYSQENIRRIKEWLVGK